DAPAVGFGETAIAQIAHEARLIDRADRPDAHRSGRGLPKVRHQPRVRVGAEASPADLPAVEIELLFAEPALEESASVHARRRVRLEKQQIPAVAIVGRAEEMIEADLEDFGHRSVTGYVPAEFAVSSIGANDH